MGLTIRHLSHLFDGINARTKLLVTLSDGKPDDYDTYHGEYGIEDTRMALFAARQHGIDPFYITIDAEARDHLPHTYGDSSYVLIDDIDKLPTASPKSTAASQADTRPDRGIHDIQSNLNPGVKTVL